MSVDLPPELTWVARLAVGQAWPKGQEDNLRALGEIWDDTAHQLASVCNDIGPTANGVLANLGGDVATQFSSFTTSLQSNLPQMSESAGKLGDFSRHTAVQVEYAKYMIIGQLIWLAYEIMQLAGPAPEAIPPAITSARAIVKLILKRLAIGVATGAAFNLGLDAIIQSIQLLKGDRKEWDTKATLQALETGAIAGGIGGLFAGVGGVVAPKFASGLAGRALIGAATGVVSTVVINAAYGGETDFLGALTSGLIGGLGGGRGGGLRGEKPGGIKDKFDLHLPDVPNMALPKLHELGAPPKVDFFGGPGSPPSRTAGGGLEGGHGAGGSHGAEGSHGSEASHGTGASAHRTESASTTGTTGAVGTAGAEGTRRAGSSAGSSSGSNATAPTTGRTPGHTPATEGRTHTGGDPAADTHAPPATAPRPSGLPGFETAPGTAPGTGRAPGDNAGTGSTAPGRQTAPGPSSPGQTAPGQTAPSTRPRTASDAGSGTSVAESSRPSASRVSTESAEGPRAAEDSSANGGSASERPGPSAIRTSTDAEHGPVAHDSTAPATERHLGSTGEPLPSHDTDTLRQRELDELTVASHPLGDGDPTTPPPPGGGTDPAAHEARMMGLLDDLPHPPRDDSPIDLAPAVPDAPLRSPAGPIKQRLDELNRTARGVGMTREERRTLTRAVQDAGSEHDWRTAGLRLEDFRLEVERRSLDQRYDSFRSHADGGFERLEALGASRPEWEQRVKAVEEARNSGDPELLGSRLREYTAYVEAQVPARALTGDDAPRPFDSRTEEVRRRLATAQDPQELARLRDRLAELTEENDIRERLVALTSLDGPGSEEAVLRRRLLAADSPEEETRLRSELTEHLATRDLEQQLDRLKNDPGTPPVTDEGLRERLVALTSLDGPDSHEAELRRQLLAADSPEEETRLRSELTEHLATRDLERQLDRLKNDPVTKPDPDAELRARLDALTDRPDDPRATELHREIAQARTEDEARRALAELEEHQDLQQLQRRFDRLRPGSESTPDPDAGLRARLDALIDRPDDPRAGELRRQALDATTPAESRRALDLLAEHRRQQEADRQDRIGADQRELDSLNERFTAELAAGEWDAATGTSARIAEVQQQLTRHQTLDERTRGLREEWSRPLERPEDTDRLNRITNGALPPTDGRPGGADAEHPAPRNVDELLGSLPDVGESPAPHQVKPSKPEQPSHPSQPPHEPSPRSSDDGSPTRNSDEVSLPGDRGAPTVGGPRSRRAPGTEQAQLQAERQRARRDGSESDTDSDISSHTETEADPIALRSGLDRSAIPSTADLDAMLTPRPADQAAPAPDAVRRPDLPTTVHEPTRSPVPEPTHVPESTPVPEPTHVPEPMHVPAPEPTRDESGTAQREAEPKQEQEQERRVLPPITPDQWQDRRDSAPAVTRDTERFLPSREKFTWQPGLLAGRMVYIHNTVRRIQADDGRWIRLISFHLPVRYGPGVTDEQLTGFQSRMRELLDQHLNTGLRLPRSGDQLHVELTFTHAPQHAQAIELTGPHEPRTTTPPRADQHHLDLAHSDADLLHELLHYAGLVDEYHDHDTPRSTTRPDTNSLMAHTDQLPDLTLSDRHLADIERISEDGTPLRDHPLPTTDHPPLRTTALDRLPPNEPLTHPAAQAPPGRRTPGDNFTVPRLQHTYTVGDDDEEGMSRSGSDDEEMTSSSSGQQAHVALPIDAMANLGLQDVSTDHGYLTFVERSTREGRQLAFVVNTMAGHHQVDEIPGVIRGLLDGLDERFRDRLVIVIGLNARQAEAHLLDAAMAEAQRLIDAQDFGPTFRRLMPEVVLVRQTPFNGAFPFGTMRNELLDSEEHTQAVRRFISTGRHPYVSIQDFDTGPRTVPDGRHVFEYFEQLLGEHRDSMDMDMDLDSPGRYDNEEFDEDSDQLVGTDERQSTVERPLMMTGGYRVPGMSEGEHRARLIRDITTRFEAEKRAVAKQKADAARLAAEKAADPDNGDTPVAKRAAKKKADPGKKLEAFLAKTPRELTDPRESEEFINEFMEAVDDDMLARETQARFHRQLPYAPEPNLFIDGAAVLPHQGSRPLPRFGLAGAEFQALGQGLNRLNAWELNRHHAPTRERLLPEVEVPRTNVWNANRGVRPDRGQDELSSEVRAEAENERLALRGTAFRTVPRDGAIVTDLSRLAYDFLKGKKGKRALTQGHRGLTTVKGRLFSNDAPKANARGALRSVRLANHRDNYQPRNPVDYLSFEHRRPNHELTRPTVLPPEVARELGSLRHNVLADGVSVPMAAPFEDIAVGISPEHRTLVAQALARNTRVIHVGRQFEYLLFGPVQLADEVRERHLAAIGRLGGSRPAEAAGIPREGDYLYHVVLEALHRTEASPARGSGEAPEALRQQAGQLHAENKRLIKQAVATRGEAAAFRRPAREAEARRDAAAAEHKDAKVRAKKAAQNKDEAARRSAEADATKAETERKAAEVERRKAEAARKKLEAQALRTEDLAYDNATEALRREAQALRSEAEALRTGDEAARKARHALRKEAEALRTDVLRWVLRPKNLEVVTREVSRDTVDLPALLNLLGTGAPWRGEVGDLAARFVASARNRVINVEQEGRLPRRIVPFAASRPDSLERIDVRLQRDPDGIRPDLPVIGELPPVGGELSPGRHPRTGVWNIPDDGDCLYHAVNAARFDQRPSALTAWGLRRQVLEWMQRPENRERVDELAYNNATHADTLRSLVGTPRDWAGQEGDVAMTLIASTLGIAITIHQDHVPPQRMVPIGGAADAMPEIHLLHTRGNHYEVHPIHRTTPPAPLGDAPPISKRPRDGDDPGTDPDGDRSHQRVRRDRTPNAPAPGTSPAIAADGTAVREPARRVPQPAGADWRHRLDQAPLFVDRCPGTELSISEMYFRPTFPLFDRSNTVRALEGSGIELPAVDHGLLDLYLDQLQSSGYLAPAEVRDRRL